MPNSDITGVPALIYCVIATVLALPGVIFVAYTNVPRRRFICSVGALVGAVAGLFLTFFLWATALNSIHLEGAVVFVVTFFISNVTGLVGALLVNFLLGSGDAHPRSSQVEY